MEIEFWPPYSNQSEIADFISNLDIKLKKKVVRDLDIIRQNDLTNLIKMGIIKRLTGVHLYEIVIKSVRVIIDIRGDTCWLLQAFLKKSNGTPERYIKTALARSQNLF